MQSEQAGIQQGLNYMGQGAAYRQNTQQLNNKKPVNTNIIGTGTGNVNQPTYQPPANNYNYFQPTQLTPKPAYSTGYQPYYNPNQKTYGAQQ